MKFRFQWKDPDWYDFPGIYQDDGTKTFNRQLTDEERDLVSESGLGEYICIEYDTETKTCTVVK